MEGIPIFDIDARQESMEKEGRVTIMASRTTNHFDFGAILNGGPDDSAHSHQTQSEPFLEIFDVTMAQKLFSQPASVNRRAAQIG
jgi:hypothetical protein